MPRESFSKASDDSPGPSEHRSLLAGDTEALESSAEGSAELSNGVDPLSMATQAVRPAVAHDPLEFSFLDPPTAPGALGNLAHYEIREVLGQGAFGIVFRAFDQTLQRVVAVKVLAPALASVGAARLRFLREGRSSAAVRHDCVVHLFAVEEEPLPYLVMEFIAGETLQDRIQRLGPLPVAETLKIGRRIAEGLAAAHRMGLIHRDIKPSNVMIDSSPLQRVKITDFGLARAADDASLTQSGVVAGTPMYMAPEQAGADAVDHRADLFSLGSVLYAMCTGRPPFRASNTLAVLKRVCEDTPRSMLDINPATPEWLCRVVAKLHAKDPAARYQSADEVAAVLADCEAQWQAHGRLRDYSRIPGGKPRRRTGPRMRLAATAIALALIALGVFALMWPPTPPLRDGKEIDISAIKTAASVQRGLPPTSIATPQRNAGAPGGCIPRCYSPDGKWLVTGGLADKIRVWEVASGALRKEFSGRPNSGNPAFSPETFSPDGSLLAVVQAELSHMDVVLVDVKSFTIQKTLKAPGNELAGLAFSPDGKRLATSSAQTVILWDVDQGVETDRIEGFHLPNGVVFHPGGKMLAVLDRVRNYKRDDRNEWAQDARISLWNVDPGTPDFKRKVREWDAPDNGYSPTVRFAANGDRLLFCRGMDTHVAVEVADVNSGRILRQLRANPNRWGHIMFGTLLPDGKSLPLLVLYQPTAVIQVWDVDAGKLLRSFPVGERLSFCDFAIDPTGATLALGGRETQSLRFFHFGRGKEVHPQGPPSRPSADAFVKRVAALPAEQQIREVVAELTRCNPGFDGACTQDIEQDRVVGLHMVTREVTDLSPVRALSQLQKLTCVGETGHNGKLTQLTALRGLPLRTLSAQGNPGIIDLTPLGGMPLESLHLWGWGGSDLTPLKGLPLKWLNCGGNGRLSDLSPLTEAPLDFLCVNFTRVSDLTPVRGMPLTTLLCENNQVSDLRPLQGMRLKVLTISNTKVNDLTPLKGMPLAQLHFDGAPVKDLTPLKELPLEIVRCDLATPGLAATLRSMASLRTINERPANEALKDLEQD